MYEIGIIAGSFDLLHPGYIKMFKESKQICKTLIIALQDDPTVERSHKCKPVQTWEEREEILSSIRYVDSVLRYTTESELATLLSGTPHDVRILGEDYLGKPFTGDFLKKKVYYCKRDHNYNLTSLKQKIVSSVCISSHL